MKLKFLNKSYQDFEDTGWIDVLVNGQSYCRYRVRNGFCTVIIESWGDWTIPKNSNKTFGILPEKYCPAFECSSCGTLKSNLGYELQLDIRTDGKIIATNLAPNASTSYFGATITFPYGDTSGGGQFSLFLKRLRGVFAC